MSDLAPFVAAAIKDRVMLELIAENKRLREEIETKRLREEKEDLLKVRITGKNGAPVYHEASILGGRIRGYDQRLGCESWVIDLPAYNGMDGHEIGLDSDTFERDFELWFGGALMKDYLPPLGNRNPHHPGAEVEFVTWGWLSSGGLFRFKLDGYYSRVEDKIIVRHVTFPFWSMIAPLFGLTK